MELIASKAGSGTSKKDQIGFFDLLQCTLHDAANVSAGRNYFSNGCAHIACKQPNQTLAKAVFVALVGSHFREVPDLVAAMPAVIPAAAALLFGGTVTVLAIYRPVTSGLKRHRGLLAAGGTQDRCTLGFTPPRISSPSSLLVLLCLAARLAAFRCRIATLPEEVLILARKGEILPTVAARQLQIRRHKSIPFVVVSWTQNGIVCE
ncbi:MAG TPA: hypothetical protein VGR47_06975 [Terracidiphilus sp.]|nr:hypothetical protein [Terracidiphilus sp.]